MLRSLVTSDQNPQKETQKEKSDFQKQCVKVLFQESNPKLRHVVKSEHDKSRGNGD